MTPRHFLLLFGLLAGSRAADTRLVRETEARTPEEERALLTVPEGFEIQLFASEPVIDKPINLAFDARGRLWVSSTAEYPYSADRSRWSDDQGTRVRDSRDAIKILEDSDGDGRADKVTVFADGLNIPTGVLPWHRPEHKAGCIAWSIPNLWYFADSDGDDKADIREILFGPLGYEKDTHGMCSSFRLGLDGWVYATHGFNNTSVLRVRPEHRGQADAQAEEPEPIELHSGNVFRFKPDGSAVEVWTRGQVNPFGLAWDRYGHLYSADCHSAPVYQLIRGAHYPSFGKPHDGLGFAPVMCEHTHGSTGICGIVHLDGGVWGPDWNDQVFVGNVVTSRVNRDQVTRFGSTPKANEQPDFIVSDDPWFRPVDLQLGPDHALYVADFYNRIIGHYEVPLDHPGRDRHRGRIWRVVKKDVPRPASVDFTRMPPAAIAGELGSPNLTRRNLALGEVRRRGDPTWLVDVARPLSPDTPYVARGDRGPDRFFAPWDSEPGDFDHEAWPQVELNPRTAWTLWALSALGERWTVSSVMRTLHTGGSWAEDKPGREHALVLSHAARILGTQTGLHPWEKWNLGILFDHRGSEPLRAATANLLQRPEFLADDPRWAGHVVSDLVQLLHGMLGGQPSEPARPWNGPDDTHLVHALRLLLRDFLAQPLVFTNPVWRERNREALGSDWFREVLFATPGVEVSRYLAASSQAGNPAANRQIARHGDDASIRHAIGASVNRLDPRRSLPGLQALHEGFQEAGRTPPAAFQEALVAVAEAVLAETEDVVPVWRALPQQAPTPAWSLRSRPCGDGTEARVLQSMGQGGGAEESRTGTLQSLAFPAPAKLTLWINGHRGPPNTPPHDRNHVRVIAADDGRELARADPPRSDTAQRFEIDLEAHAGRSVQLEIVDGDDGKAYAWLGLTRIEPAVIKVEAFADDTTQTLQQLAVLIGPQGPVGLRDRLSAYLPSRPAPPPLPVSPEQRRQLDKLIAARTTAFGARKPDAAAGAAVFQTHCAACHQIGGLGGLIGPQLDGIGTRGVARLCEDILDPNRNVDAHFHLHLLTLKDGMTLSGFLKAVSGQVLVLADATGRETRVAKRDVATDEVQPISLMPPVFAQTIPEADFLALLAWLLER